MHEFSIRGYRPSRMVPREDELPAPVKVTPEVKAQAVALHKEGKSVKEIAKLLGLSYSQAYQMVYKLKKKATR